MKVERGLYLIFTVLILLFFLIAGCGGGGTSGVLPGATAIPTETVAPTGSMIINTDCLNGYGTCEVFSSSGAESPYGEVQLDSLGSGVFQNLPLNTALYVRVYNSKDDFLNNPGNPAAGKNVSFTSDGQTETIQTGTVEPTPNVTPAATPTSVPHGTATPTAIPGNVLVVDPAGGGDGTTIIEVLAIAEEGDTVLVKAGTYTSRVIPPSGVTLLAEEGPLETKIYVPEGGQGILIDEVNNVTVDGFEVYSDPNAGSPTNGLVYIEDSQNIVVRNCLIHDAPNDGDVLKVNGTQDLLIEKCILWNPSYRSDGIHFQECMDIRGHGDERITVRGCWLFHEGSHGDYLIYAKGGTKDLLWENNIFGPSAGGGWQNTPVETGHLSYTDGTPYESENFVVRNNLLAGLRGTCAFAFAGPNTAIFYNNVFYKNDTVNKAMIELTENKGTAGGPCLNVYSFNNVFCDNGSLDIYWVRDSVSGQNLVRDYNFYYQSGSGGDLSLGDETNSIQGQNPGFLSPSIPSFNSSKGTEQIEEILNGF